MPQLFISYGENHYALHSDFMAYKEIKGSDKSRSYRQLLSFTLIGEDRELEKIAKQKARITLTHDRESHYASDLSNFHLEKQKGSGLYSRYLFTRRINRIISRTEESEANKSYPLVTVNPTRPYDLEDLVYRSVKGLVPFGMMNVVTEPLLMARELMTDVSTAEKILSGNKADQALFSRAQKLLKWYEEWKGYLYTELDRASFIRPVIVAFSPEPIEMYEVIVDEKRVAKIISHGLKTKQITFSDAPKSGNVYRSFDSYMPAFAKTFKSIIGNLSKPKHKNGHIRKETLQWFEQLKRKPLDGQKDPMEAALKALKEKGKVNIVGECGTGKSFQMSAAAYIDSRYSNKAMKLLVYCPDTLVNTVWRDEIHQTIPDCSVHVIHRIQDLIDFERAGYLHDEADRAFILSQGAGKAGYTLKPAVRWSKAKQAFQCETCGAPVLKKTANPAHVLFPEEPKYIELPAPFDHFKSQRYNNYKCSECEEVLWGPNNRKATTYKAFISGEAMTKKESYLYISGHVKGYFPKDAKPVRERLKVLVRESHDAPVEEEGKYRRNIEGFRNLQMTIEGTLAEARKIQPYQVSIAQYIFKKLKRTFTHLICDEFHEYQGESARSEACSKLIASVPKVITGTGTAMNGYAKSRFFTDYMLFPEKLKAAGYSIDDQEKYQVTFGVTEKRYRVVNKDGRWKRESLAPRPRPGISPIIFPLFMQDTTVFVSLNDLKKDLPPLEHTQIEVEMDSELYEAKGKLESQIRDATRGDMKLFRGSLPLLYSFLDMPTVPKKLEDSDGNLLAETPVISSYADNKLNALLDTAHREVREEGRRMLLYTYFTTDGINGYLSEHLKQEGYRVTVLNKQEENSFSCDGTTAQVLKGDRELYIREEVKKGTEILIVNPELVKTGYNLIDFSTILYYQMSHQLYTNRQADLRTFRIGQTRDCKIIYLYYKHSMQSEIASLMATKIVASRAIEGNMDSAGLRAISQTRTAEEELAERFFEGITQ